MQAFCTSLYNQKGRLFQTIIIIIVAFGVVLRASKYLPAFSMRGDELAVTLNLIHRSPIDLMTKALDYEQAAPVGFVLLIKILMTALGQSEYVLRLVAFVAGCVSLILMQNLLTKTGGRYGNLFALAAFACGGYLIYYSTELKPYSSDVLLCLILVLLFHRQLSKEAEAKDFVALATLGLLALCFSYPASFVLAGIGTALFFYYWKDKRRLLWITLTGILWAGTFLVLYLLLLRQQTQDTYLITFWANLLSFMPMPPWRDITWFPKAFTGLFFVVAGLSSWLLLVIPIYLLGLWAFWTERKWQWILILTIPIGLNILVSGFQKYPFHGRLILYLLPLVFVTLGKGIDFLISLIRNQIGTNIAFAALLMLMLQPVISTTNSYLFTHSYLQDDLKPVLGFIEKGKQSGDLVYLYHYLEQPYTYYAPSYHLEGLSFRVGENNAGNARKYQVELSSLPKGRRIWFLFSFVTNARVDKGEKQNEREYILNYLRENGTILDEFYSSNNASSAHLFIFK